MSVLMISPGYPAEMPFFTRGLAELGERVVGLGTDPPDWLPELARQSLAEYLRVPSLWDEAAVLRKVRAAAQSLRIERVECLWEPGMLLAARLREALGVPGMSWAETVPFRDKEQMKLRLDAAGIRTPRHRTASTVAGVREAAEAIGFPLILKPIAGAGSADTHRCDDRASLESVLPSLRHVPELSVEEFIDGEEYTYDTICAGGEVLHFNISWYRPRPLIGRTVPWISPQTVTLRNVDAPELAAGRDMGLAVLEALGFRTGFTHMEWYRKADGEAVFGEIAARPPGARSVDTMNYSLDADLFRGWAEAVTRGRISQPLERRFNTAIVFKRAEGSGRITRVSGLERLLAELGPQIVAVDLLAPGSERRDWKKTLLSDGFAIVRHPDLATTLELADRIGTDLRMYAS